MRHRRDDADDAERSVLFEREVAAAAERGGAQELDAGRTFAGSDELLDLVLESANFRFLELFEAEHLRFLDADFANAIGRFLASVEAELVELLLCFRSGGDGVVDVVEDT